MRRLAALAGAAALAGCTVGPDFRRPDVASPPAYGDEPRAVPSRTYGGAVDTEWWTRFGDPTLTGLVRRLAAQNLDLKAAAERIEQARAEIAVTRAQAIPHIGTQASYTRIRQSQNGFLSLVQPAPGAPFEYSEYQPKITASWEVDLFGRVRRQVEAARADAEAEVENRHALALAAVAQLAQTYMQLRQAQAQEALLHRNVEIARARSKLVRDQFAQGAANTLAVAQADAQVSTIEQDLPTILANEAALGNAVALLLAEPPRALDAELAARPGVQPAVPPVVPVGLPGELVRRRPDIRRAEAQLHAATAQTGVAVAAFYPDISFSGNFGVDSLKTHSLFEWASRTFALSPTVNLPIFQGGALRGNLELAKAGQREAAIGFQQTVLNAWHEVDNALTAYARSQQSRANAAATLDANRRALAAAQAQYDQGATAFLDVVEAQAAVIGSQNAVVQANEAIEAGLVQLYKALGGGWQAVPEATKATDAATRGRGAARAAGR